jgi:hypothetical protein
MKVWKDAVGREWSLTLNVRTVKQVRDEIRIDLTQTEKSLPLVMDDPVALGDILWVLCRKQAEERGINQDQFLEALKGEALDEARTQFVEEWVSFFPPSETAKRYVIRQTLEMVRRTNDAYRAEVERQFQRLADQRILEEQARMELQKAMNAEASGRLSTSSPESSEWTRDHTPSASSSG